MLVGRAKEVGVHLGKETKKEGNRRRGNERIVFLYVVLVGLEFALYTKPSYNL